MTDLPLDTPCYIRSRPPYSSGKLHLTVSATGQVTAALFVGDSGLQKWKIVKRADEDFDIVNVATGTPLGAERPSTYEREYTPSVSGNIKTAWDIKCSDTDGINQCIIKATSDSRGIASKVLDLSQGRVVFWEQNRHQNQEWRVEPIDTTPPPKVRWELVVGGNFPSSAVQGGNDTNGDPLYVTRAVIPQAGEFHCGKGGPHLAQYQYCLIPWDHTERSCAVFEVLVADPGAVFWKAWEGSRVNPLYLENPDGTRLKPVKAGAPSLYHDFYPIRADVNGHTTPGKGSLGGLWIGFDGEERTISGKFEVLCYSPSNDSN